MIIGMLRRRPQGRPAVHGLRGREAALGVSARCQYYVTMTVSHVTLVGKTN